MGDVTAYNKPYPKPFPSVATINSGPVPRASTTKPAMVNPFRKIFLRGFFAGFTARSIIAILYAVIPPMHSKRACMLRRYCDMTRPFLFALPRPVVAAQHACQVEA